MDRSSTKAQESLFPHTLEVSDPGFNVQVSEALLLSSGQVRALDADEEAGVCALTLPTGRNV